MVLDMTVLQKSSEVAGKLGSPEQLSDQISVLDKMAAEMDTDGKLLSIICYCYCCVPFHPGWLSAPAADCALT